MDTDIMALAQELAEISRLVEGDDIEATLDRYVRRLVATVPDCDEAAIVVAGQKSFEIIADHAGPHAIPALDRDRALLDAELVRTDGPMRDVVSYGEPHKIADAQADDRWPTLSAAMVATSYRSALLLPLASRSDNAAGFALFSGKPGAFAETTYDLALLFALHAGAAFDNAQLFHDSRSLIDQLYTALATRTAIGQAEGLLMHRYGLNSEIAFQVLRRGSQTNNVKLRDLAHTLIEAHEQGTLTDALTKHGLASLHHPS